MLSGVGFLTNQISNNTGVYFSCIGETNNANNLFLRHTRFNEFEIVAFRFKFGRP